MKTNRDGLLGTPSVSTQAVGKDSSRASPKWSLIVICVLGALVVGAASYFAGRNSVTDPKSVSQVPQATTKSQPTQIESKPSAGLAEPKHLTADLSGTLSFSVPRECTAGGTLDKIFVKLDKAMASPGAQLAVKLDEYSKPIPVGADSKIDGDGARVASAQVRFLDSAKWNELTLSRARVSIYSPPEPDSAYTRSLTFLNSPKVVRATLNRLGFGVPLSPSYAELHDDACGGSMQVEAISGGATLSCGWGC